MLGTTTLFVGLWTRVVSRLKKGFVVIIQKGLGAEVHASMTKECRHMYHMDWETVKSKLAVSETCLVVELKYRIYRNPPSWHLPFLIKPTFQAPFAYAISNYVPR